MEITRVVELVRETRRNGPAAAISSGYLLADGLILTTRHGVGERIGSPCEYRVATDPTAQARVKLSPWLKAKVVWNGGKAIDAALLEPQGARIRKGLTPVSLGYAAGNALVPARAVGFPNAIEGEDESELFDAFGDITPLTGSRGGSPVFRTTATAPVTAEGWKGMSGAAVFAGDLLVGLVEEVVPKLGVMTLRLVGTGRLLDDPGAKALLGQAGIGVAVVAPVTRQRALAAPSAGSWEPLRRRYSAAVVDFYGRLDHGAALDSTHQPLRVLDAFRGQRFKYRDTDGDPARRLEELSSKLRFVVLGEPGSGKSTALKQAVALAVQADALCVPLWLPIGAVQALEPLTIPVLIRHAVERAAALGLDGVNEYFFETAASEGRLVFAFDALDEAPDARRGALRDLVANVARTFSKCRVWLSSRPAQYDALKLVEERANATSASPTADPSFGVFEIEPLAHEEIARFLAVCFKDDGSLAVQLLSRAEIAPLLATPHFLSMTARIVSTERRIPDGRAEIFARWIELVCRTWEDGKRSAPTPDELVAQRKRGLQLLAWSLQTKGTPAATFSRRDAQRAMAPLFGAVRELGAEGLVKWFVERSDLLEVASGQFGLAGEELRFSHRQYQEFLAGAEFASLWSSDRAQAAKSIAGQWFSDDWLEVLNFAAAQFGSQADELIDTVRALPERSSELVLRRDLFAAELVGQAPLVSHTRVTTLADALVKELMKAPSMYFEVVRALIGLGRHPAAAPIVERIANGNLQQAFHKKYPRAFDIPNDEGDLTRLEAIAEIGLRVDPQRALALLEDMPEPSLLEAEPRREIESVAVLVRYQLGDRARAAELLHVALGTATSTHDWRVTLDVFFERGAAAFADRAIDRVIREHPELVTRLGQAAMAVQRRVLALDSALMMERLAAATSRLASKLPNDSYAHDMHADVEVLMELLPVDRPPATMLRFLEAVLANTELLWRWADKIQERVPELSLKAVDAMCRYAVDWERYGDWSRRNGLMRSLERIPDDALIVPRLLELVGVPSVFAHSGEYILRSLQARGKEAETLAVLKARALDPATADLAVSAAIDAAVILDAGSVDAWIGGGGVGAQRVKRLRAAPVRVVTRDRGRKRSRRKLKTPRAPTLRSLAAELKPLIAPRGVPVRHSRDPSENTPDLGDVTDRLDSMVDIGRAKEAMQYADQWIRPLDPADDSDAFELANRLLRLSHIDLWSARWTPLLERAVRTLKPKRKSPFVDLLERRSPAKG